MHVQVHIDEDAPRGWHRVLLGRLAGRPGRTAEVVLRSGGLARDRHRIAVGALLAIDRVTGRMGPAPLAGTCPASVLRAAAGRAPRSAGQATRIVLDLTADGRVAHGDGAAWRLLYDGRTGESALVAALLEGRSPVASVEGPNGTLIAARLGTDRHGLFRPRMEDALARTITVLVAAVEGTGTAVLPSGPDDEAGPGRRSRQASCAPQLLGAVGRAFATRVGGALSRERKWRVAWRLLKGGADSVEAGRPADAHWRVLPDDGRRFYADPFPIVHEGRTTLFVEDYEQAAGRGVISAVRFGPDGPEGSPQVVLAEAHHLSYPFVFAHDGALWMVPESSGNRTIDLYRARAFPRGWVKAATLVRDVVASDATLLRHEGRWWLFATVRDGPEKASGSYSDALHIWSAPHLTGPWTAHPANPVLVDAGSARPAGRFVTRGEVLLRPAQDCRHSYGGAVVIARIDRLDEGGFAQSIIGRIEPGRHWSRHGVHTLNRADDLEVIDGFA